MTIRKKLLLFIPLLVLLVNLVTFLLFQSGQIVQKSYNLMMERLLTYKQVVVVTEASLKSLYNYLLQPDDTHSHTLLQTQHELQDLINILSKRTSPSFPITNMKSYTHMMDTLLEQEQSAIAATSSRNALANYEVAEQTTTFIREEGQHLVDLELNFFQPIFLKIQNEHEVLNRLGVTVFAILTIMSILLAFWISHSITRPVNQLVNMARSISKGNLHIIAPTLHSNDELGILSSAFIEMSLDLQVFIEKDKENLEKDRLIKELELQALQSQINPHFLFNTLNALSKLALLEGAEKSSDLIISMSNLLRYNLGKLDHPVTLREELEHVKEYFTIQQARFRNRIRFELDIDESTLQESIPALTLQPIVENAFLHGIEHMEKDAVIRLEIMKIYRGVRVSIIDNGSGMSDEVRESLLRLETKPHTKQSSGLGTSNVFRRLRLFYRCDNLINIHSELGKGTTVTITIPRKKDEPTDVPTIDRR